MDFKITLNGIKTCCGSNAQNGFAYCCSNSDPDDDGWGWENNASCIVPGSAPDEERCGTVVTELESEVTRFQKEAYPNPFSYSLQIQVKGFFHYTLSNASGQKREEGNGIDRREVANSLPKGLYILQIQSQGTSKTIKVVKH